MRVFHQNEPDVSQGLKEISPASKVLMLIAVVLIIYWQTVFSLLQRWWVSPTYGHGLLVLPIVFYLIWHNRHKVNEKIPQPRYWLLPPLIVFCFLWLMSNLVDIVIGQQLSLIVLIALSVAVVFGERILLSITFPLLYLFVAIPVWDSLEPILQMVTVKFVSIFLGWANIPHLVEQHYITIPEGKFSVESVCAGLRFFMASVAISLLFAYFNLRTRLMRVVFVCVALVGSIAVNWIRVFIVVIAGHLTEMQHWLVHSHVGFGWWLFAGFLVPLFWFGRVLENKEYAVDEQNKAEPEKTSHSNRVPKNIRPLTVGLVLLPLVLAPFSALMLKEAPQTTNVFEIKAPESQGEWQEPSSTNAWRVEYPGSDAKLLVEYAGRGMKVILLSVYFKTQGPGKELVSESNRLYDSKRWHVTDKRLHKENGKQYLELDLLSQLTDQKRVIRYWYNVGGIQTTNGLEAKFLHAFDLIREAQGSLLIAVAVDHGGDNLIAKKFLDRFMQEIPLSTMLVHK